MTDPRRERLSQAVNAINEVLAQPTDEPVRPDDEGELYVVVSVKDGMIFIDFGKPVKWLSLGKADAEALIDVLEHRLAEIGPKFEPAKCPLDTNGDGDCHICAHYPERCLVEREVAVPYEVGTRLNYYGCKGYIRERKQDSVDPVHWRYEVKWRTGTFGWWGHDKVKQMSPTPPA
jgi:hypothetical protein